MTYRKSIAEHGTKAAMAIRSQTHAGVIDQSGFGNGDVTTAIWKLERNGWSGPLTILHIFDLLALVCSFIVPVKIMKPACRIRWKREYGRFIRHSNLAISRNHITKRNAVVEYPDIDREVSFRGRVSCTDTR